MFDQKFFNRNFHFPENEPGKLWEQNPKRGIIQVWKQNPETILIFFKNWSQK